MYSVDEFSREHKTAPSTAFSVPHSVSGDPPTSTGVDNSKPRSLADYFSSHSSDSCEIGNPTTSLDNAPEEPFLSPFPVDSIRPPISFVTHSSTGLAPIAPEYQADNVFNKLPQCENNKPDFSEPVEKLHYVPQSGVKLDFVAAQSGSVDEEKFDNV